jgi:rod shape-determining protein MreC
MPLGTLDRSTPPLFNQGPSALSKLIFFSALALFLMVADARFGMVRPIRLAIGTVLYPVQWLALKPVQAVAEGGRYLEELQLAQRNEAEARRALALQSERAGQADVLARENARLRALLELRQTTSTPGRAAEVLYDSADPYTRKVVVDQGVAQGVVAGSPVIDPGGVVGQVTLVQPFTSEVTLLVDRDQAIPVQNTRTGARSVAFGDANAHGGGLELRFMAANSDVQEGDMLTTSGVDGVYPPGLPVARIERIERRADSGFARIYCQPLGDVNAARYVLVLAPVGGQGVAPSAAAASAPGAAASTAAAAKASAPASSPATGVPAMSPATGRAAVRGAAPSPAPTPATAPARAANAPAATPAQGVRSATPAAARPVTPPATRPVATPPAPATARPAATPTPATRPVTATPTAPRATAARPSPSPATPAERRSAP